MAKCSNCGALIPQGGSFCPRCGAQVTARPSSNRNRNRSRNPKAPGPETETASFPGQADPRYNDPAYTDPNAAANSAAYYNQTQPQLQNGAFANNYQTQPQVSMAAGQAAVTANPGRKLGTFFGICSFLFSIVGFFWSLRRTTHINITFYEFATSGATIPWRFAVIVCLVVAGCCHKTTNVVLALNVCAHPEVTPFVFDSYEAVRDYLLQSTRQSLRSDGEKMFAHVAGRFRWQQNVQALLGVIKSIVPEPGTKKPSFIKNLVWLFWNTRESLRQNIYKKWVKRR